MRERRPYDNAVPDMLAVQIKNGRIEARVNLGVSSTVFSLNSSQLINDGEWHILTIVASRLVSCRTKSKTWQEKKINLVKCRYIAAFLVK